MKIIIVCLLLPIQSYSLGLNEYIQQLKTNDVEAEKILSQSLKVRFNKDLKMPNRQVLFNIKDEFGIQPDSDKTTSRLTAQATKSFVQTGTDINVSFTSNDLTDRKEQIQNFTLEQDLVRNSFGARNRKLNQVLNTENEIIKLQTTESYEDYILQKIYSYLDFQLTYQSLKTAEQLYKDTLDLQREILKRQKNNIADEVDVERVKLQIINRKKSVLDRKQNFNSQKINILKSLGRLDEKHNITPDKNIEFLNEKIDFQNQLNSFWNSGRSIKILKLSEENSQHRIWIQKKDLLPKANILLGYNIDDSQRFTTQTNREETLVGLSLEFSLGDSVNNAEIKQAEYEKTQSKLELKAQSETLKAIFTELQSRIEIHNQKMKLLNQQVQSAKALLRGEKKRFKNGRTDLKTVIDSENLLADTEFEAIQQKIELAKTIAEWMSLTDTLVTDLDGELKPQ